jgi:hypothetical protein
MGGRLGDRWRGAVHVASAVIASFAARNRSRPTGPTGGQAVAESSAVYGPYDGCGPTVSRSRAGCAAAYACPDGV